MFVEQVKRKKGTVIARRGASSSPLFSGSEGSRVHLLCPGSAPWEAAGPKEEHHWPGTPGTMGLWQHHEAV